MVAAMAGLVRVVRRQPHRHVVVDLRAARELAVGGAGIEEWTTAPSDGVCGDVDEALAVERRRQTVAVVDEA